LKTRRIPAAVGVTPDRLLPGRTDPKWVPAKN
jgi:hypothetical protein